jgi:hypothetical protein
MPLPLGPIAAAAARATVKKLAARATGGITGTGAKSVNPTYKQMIASKGKKEAAGYAAGAGATAAWFGTQTAIHWNDPMIGGRKNVPSTPASKPRGGGGSKQKKK